MHARSRSALVSRSPDPWPELWDGPRGKILALAGNHRRQGGGDLSVAPLGRVLVPQRGRDLAVAKPLLEVGEGRTRTGRPRRAGVPEVGHPQVRSPAASRGIRKFRWSVDACTCDTPSRPGKCNASGHTAVIASRWCAIAGTTCGGTDTTLVPRRRLSGSPRWPGHRPMTPHGRPSPSRPRCPRPCDAARSPPH